MEKDNTQDKQIIVLENNYSHMSEQIKDLKKAVDVGFSSIKEELKAFRDDADKKYASKLTEQIVYGLVVLILVAFTGGLVTIVIK